jgi:hypothetical protein
VKNIAREHRINLMMRNSYLFQIFKYLDTIASVGAFARLDYPYVFEFLPFFDFCLPTRVVAFKQFILWIVKAISNMEG